MGDYKKCCFQMECFILYVIIFSDRLGMLKGKLDKYFSKHAFIPYRPYIYEFVNILGAENCHQNYHYCLTHYKTKSNFTLFQWECSGSVVDNPSLL